MHLVVTNIFKIVYIFSSGTFKLRAGRSRSKFSANEAEARPTFGTKLSLFLVSFDEPRKSCLNFNSIEKCQNI